MQPWLDDSLNFDCLSMAGIERAHRGNTSVPILQYDVIVWGCTGQLGYAVMDFFARIVAPEYPKLRWALVAATSAESRALRALVHSRWPFVQAPIIIAALENISEVVCQTQLVLDLAGPCPKRGTSVVDACVRLGADCVVIVDDGSPDDIYSEYHLSAKARNLLIISMSIGEVKAITTVCGDTLLTLRDRSDIGAHLAEAPADRLVVESIDVYSDLMEESFEARGNTYASVVPVSFMMSHAELDKSDAGSMERDRLLLRHNSVSSACHIDDELHLEAGVVLATTVLSLLLHRDKFQSCSGVISLADASGSTLAHVLAASASFKRALMQKPYKTVPSRL